MYTAGVYGVAEIGIFVMFGGAIEVFADLDFGLSSRGITQDLNHDGRPDGNVLNGFFSATTGPAPNKPDEFELGVKLQLYGAVQRAEDPGLRRAGRDGPGGAPGDAGGRRGGRGLQLDRPPSDSTARSAWG